MTDFKKDIQCCIETLQSGGLILYPTDTIWGIGCDATNNSAVDKIFQIKKRPSKKTMILLVNSVEMVKQYVRTENDKLLNYLIKQKDATTGIFTDADNLPYSLIHEDGTIAIRITKDPFCKDLINLLGKPIVSTSANLSGNASAALFREIDPLIKQSVDYIVHHRRDDSKKAIPSHIVKIDNNNELIFLR
ncbi:MAG: L-threonylcarbamoyladenylate synthase [Ginsengibacter sp.]